MSQGCNYFMVFILQKASITVFLPFKLELLAGFYSLTSCAQTPKIKDKIKVWLLPLLLFLKCFFKVSSSSIHHPPSMHTQSGLDFLTAGSLLMLQLNGGNGGKKHKLGGDSFMTTILLNHFFTRNDFNWSAVSWILRVKSLQKCACIGEWKWGLSPYVNP